MTAEQEALLMRVEMKLDMLLSGVLAMPAGQAPDPVITQSKGKEAATTDRQKLINSLGAYLGTSFTKFLK